MNEIEKLRQENAELKKYIERMDKPEIQVIDAEILTLKEENAELKARIKKYAELNEIDTRDYAALHNENIKLNAIIGQLEKEIKELAHYLACMTEQRNNANTILQEIKEICKMDCGDCQYNQDCDCNFEECEEAKIDDILDLITKAEV